MHVCCVVVVFVSACLGYIQKSKLRLLYLWLDLIVGCIRKDSHASAAHALSLSLSLFLSCSPSLCVPLLASPCSFLQLSDRVVALIGYRRRWRRQIVIVVHHNASSPACANSCPSSYSSATAAIVQRQPVARFAIGRLGT